MPQDLFEVVSVECRNGHLLRLRFEDGASGIFDMAPWMLRKPYAALVSPAVFNRARVAFGTVVWPGGIDIDPETLRNGSRILSEDTDMDCTSVLSCVAEAQSEYDADRARKEPEVRAPVAPATGNG